MTSRSALFGLCLVLVAPIAQAQFQGGRRYGNLTVRVTYTDGRAVTVQPLVQLMTGTATPVAEEYANEQGMASFQHVEVGMYHVHVSGQGIEDGDSGSIEIDERRGAQTVFIAVRRVGEGNAQPVASNPVSAAELKIPDKARKEFNKAGDLINQKEWQKAIEHLDRAVAIYPNYPAAYNNLAFAYEHLGDRTHQEEALKHAISINDRFAPAYVNLARLRIKDNDLSQAEALLAKATAADANNPEAFSLLANVELANKQYDDAVANCRKVHAMPDHQRYAVVHYLAARAFEHENKLQDAAAELRTFLQEEPSGARADAARKELAAVQAHLAH
jgi:tetratricopeptide (TPR) repeat protein